jgi:hypothetical protein
MMVGGPVEHISVDSRAFSVAADSDPQLKLGGFKTTVRRNGNGTSRVTGERVPWSVSDIDVSIDLDNDDLGFLQRTANGLEPVTCTITLVDGTTYQGEGLVVDEIAFSTQKATARISLMGKGELTSQSDAFF